MTLGQKIKKLRIEQGLTQKDLADQVFVTFQTVSKWEKDENEPDVSTLRELAKLFNCSMDYLLSEDDEKEQETKEEVVEQQPVVAPAEPVTKTIIIHQKELHVCERCKKDISEDELDIWTSPGRPAGRGRSAQPGTTHYYHKKCLAEEQEERQAIATKLRAEKASRAKKYSFGWGIAGGVVALIISLLVFFLAPSVKEVVHPALAVLYSVLISYGIFAMLYCIISGSYIGDVFVWCASLSIKFPGLIFTWDIEGFIWVIAMKILFAILGFLIGLFALAFAIVFSASLGAISFPFVLIHNIHNDYDDSLTD
jgi:transcriptional regulator with XRE-family HTH domain